MEIIYGLGANLVGSTIVLVVIIGGTLPTNHGMLLASDNIRMHFVSCMQLKFHLGLGEDGKLNNIFIDDLYASKASFKDDLHQA